MITFLAAIDPLGLLIAIVSVIVLGTLLYVNEYIAATYSDGAIVLMAVITLIIIFILIQIFS